MAESYYLKLLGFPELRRADGRPVKLKVRKHLALLIYLVVDAREHYYRDELAELLWPEVPEANSRHSLSMAFSVLRSLFGPGCVQGNHAVVRFAFPGLSLDLEQLESGEVLGNATRPTLEVDAFLRDFQIEDAPAFQHWRDRRNAQLLPMTQAGILILIDQARRSGDMRRIMALADRLLGLDPLAEEGIRARMEAFAMQGDRINALRVYEDWKRQLSDELGATPSEILEGMAARLRRRGVEPTPVPMVREARTEPCFVGRTAEYQALYEAWESTLQLNTRHVLLSGESGIGKSTLAMRFASSAALEGAAVARVQCFELEQRIPFGMIGALVTALLERPAVLGTAPESLAEVARVIPRVRERFPNLPSPRHSEGETARLHFAEGTFAIFDAVMEEQPLILIIDDYPRSDEASLSVLHMLLRRAANDRLMVVLSGRPPEPDEPPQAGRIRKGVSYLPMQRVELLPLSDAEGDDLLRALLVEAGKEPGSPERRAILRTAGGNPLALELLTKDWMTHGDAALAVLLPAMADVPGSALEAIGYDRLIERILPALAPRTRVALYLSAVLGPRLNDLDCFSIIDFTPAQTMAALSELVECRVLRNTGKALEFVNELIRARLYLKIPEAARVRLHYGVADRLLAAVERGEAIPGLEIAWHCMRARRREEATPYLLTGARSAITHGAPDEAARALSSALGQLKGNPRTEATLLLAETYQEMACWREALECLGRVSNEDNLDLRLTETTNVLITESRFHLGELTANQLLRATAKLIEGARRHNSAPSRVRSGLSAATLAGILRDPELISTARQAIDDVPDAELDRMELGKLLLARAMTSYHTREKDNGLAEVRAAARILEEVGASDTTFVQIHTGVGAIAALTGRYADGVVSLEHAYNAAHRLENTSLMCVAASNLALCHYRLGLPEQYLRWATLAWNHSESSPSGSYDRIFAVAQCTIAYAGAGQTRNALRGLTTLREVLAVIEIPWIRQAARLYEADICWLLRREKEALDALEGLREDADRALSTGFEGRFARWNTLFLLRAGKPKEAEDYLASIRSRMDRFDALDRAEVFCSLALLRRNNGSQAEEARTRARLELARLPVACFRQLEQFGLRLTSH
jgi:DNA-binding SARP family transcriptional activator/tetratricopeptide (TPR) repeat protein